MDLKFDTHEGQGGIHYKKNKVTETIILMENVAINIITKYINNLDDLDDFDENIVRKATNASYAMKHLNRLETKEDTDLDEELLKAENYLHRARTGEWIQK